MRNSDSVEHVEKEVTDRLDEAIEALKWCKRHRSSRRALDVMRVVQMNLGYIALSVEWQMEGDPTKAGRALNKLWGDPVRYDDPDEWFVYPDGH